MKIHLNLAKLEDKSTGKKMKVVEDLKRRRRNESNETNLVSIKLKYKRYQRKNITILRERIMENPLDIH